MSHIETWEDLLSLLRSERTTYQQLSTLLIRELDALRNFSDQTLLELAEKKTFVLEELRVLDQRRVFLFARLLGPIRTPNPSEWLRMLPHGPSPWGAQATQEFQNVISLARTVGQQGRQNAELAHRGVSMVREALRLIYSGGEVDPVYQGSGTLRLPTLTSSLSIRG